VSEDTSEGFKFLYPFGWEVSRLLNSTSPQPLFDFFPLFEENLCAEALQSAGFINHLRQPRFLELAVNA
jgi:hypothetical protein